MMRTNLRTDARTLRWPVLFCASLLLAESHAQSTDAFSPQVWINPGIFSRHFDRGKNLREDNLGIGAELLLHEDHALLAGSIINSDRQRTRYGAYHWRPLHWDVASLKVSAGMAVGAFDGYPRYHNGGWFVAPLPLVAVEGARFGANISIVPTIRNRLNGAVAVQFKMKVW